MGKSMKANISGDKESLGINPGRWVASGELKRHFKKHPCRDLNGRYYAYDTDGRVLGYVEYRRGVVILRKTYKKPQRPEVLRENS